ncbi:MAG: hypothetical protein ACFCU7_11025 [Pleurocapsa sp.]
MVAEFPTSTSPTFSASILPSPYLTSDFVSKKNYLGLFNAHVNFSDRLNVFRRAMQLAQLTTNLDRQTTLTKLNTREINCF